jgi:A/G-specific adenine glycosylase
LQSDGGLDARTLRRLRAKLTQWYESAKRDLPWRRTRDPYAVWISEIMLQQTRVAAVIPYYERFLKRFPNPAALAEAPEDELLAVWSGLGYYSRARNLKKAAGQIAAAGEFPREHARLLELAGVGGYTAAAIASIAFGEPHAAVDGNVRRVIARLVNAADAGTQAIADALLDRGDPGRWNQAVMELGATVCLAGEPLCGECPIRSCCAAFRAGTQRELPPKRAKPEPERLERTLAVIRRGERFLVAPSARVGGFWDLPEPGPGIRCGALYGEFRHTITHRHYRFAVREGRVRSTPQGMKWAAPEEFATLPLSTTARKALRVYNSGAKST